MSPWVEEIKEALREVLREEFDRRFGPATPQAANDPIVLLDVTEAAKFLGLSESTVYKKSRACELTSVKMGTRTLFRPKDLETYVESKLRSPERVRALARKA